MISREEAQKLVEENLSQKTQSHCREVEVIMKKVAEELKADPEVWGMAGLLHDLDFELPHIEEDFSKHGIHTKEMIGEDKLPAEAWHAIAAHNGEMNGTEVESNFDFALRASDNISGLIYATALIYPDKKVASVKVKSITKRMKTPAFARNVNRESIQMIEKTGLTLERFIELALEAMREIADEVGL